LRKKKWLLVIVAILFLINIGFYAAIRLGKVDQIVKNRVENYLTEQMKAEIVIKDFSFNDKQLNINGLQIKGQEHDYFLDIKQVYIEYNLSMLIFSNFTNLRAIREIKIFDPVLEAELEAGESTQEEFEIPDLSNFFKRLKLFNGKIDLKYSTETFNLHTVIDTLDLSIINSNKTELDFQISNQDNSRAEGSAELRKNELINAALSIEKFSPVELELTVLDNINFDLDLELKKDESGLLVTGNVNDLALSRQDMEFTADPIRYRADEKIIDLELPNALLDDNRIKGSMQIRNYTGADNSISGEVELLVKETSKYFEDLHGALSLKSELQGSLSAPEAEFDLNSNRLELFDQELNDLVISGQYAGDSVDFILKKVTFEDNKLTGKGSYQPENGFDFTLEGRDFVWNSSYLSISGDLRSGISYQHELNADLHVRDVALQYGELELTDLDLTGNLLDSKADVLLKRNKNDMILNCTADLSRKNINAEMRITSFDLAEIVNDRSLPGISGTISLQADPKTVNIQSSIRVYDRNYAKLDGRFILNSRLDLENNASTLSLRSSQATYNYKPLTLNLFASGTLDSLSIRRADLNREIFISGWGKLKPEPQYDLDLNLSNIDLREYLMYTASAPIYNSFNGKVSLELNFSNYSEHRFKGELNVTDLRYDQISGLNFQSRISGNLYDLNLDNSIVLAEDGEITRFNSQIQLVPEFMIKKSVSSIRDLDLQHLFSDDMVSGRLNADFSICHTYEEQMINLKADVWDLKAGWFKADSLICDMTQYPDYLQINKFTGGRNKRFSAELSGKIGYDFLTSNIYPDSNT